LRWPFWSGFRCADGSDSGPVGCGRDDARCVDDAPVAVTVGGAGGGAVKASIQGLSVTEYTDAFTPLLLQRLVTGTHIATGRLEVATRS
jgi:hypothetical protein